MSFIPKEKFSFFTLGEDVTEDDGKEERVLTNYFISPPHSNYRLVRIKV